MRALAALLLIASLALPALAQEAGERQEVPIHVPYDNVTNYTYPYIPPTPPPQPIWQIEENWLRWWIEFGGGGLDEGGGQDEGEGDEGGEDEGGGEDGGGGEDEGGGEDGGGGEDEGEGEDGGGGEDGEDEDKPPPTVYVVWVVKPVEPNIYWKDKTYDVYNGWNWSTSGNGSFSTTHGENKTEFQVLRILNDGNYTLQLIRPATSGSSIDLKSFRVNGSANYSEIEIDSYHDYLFEINASANTTITYNATFYHSDSIDNRSVGTLGDIPPEILSQNLQLPGSMDPQLRELAENLTDSDMNLLQQVEKNRDWVHEWVEYDLFWASNITIPNGTEMANWTYTHRKGICAHYATLFTAISRLQGIPARISTGFAGGYPVENATYIFPMFAHAWAEAYIPPYGWIPIDPTGNVTEREDEETGEKQEVKIEWSDAGKTTIDLQFTLNRTLEKSLNEIFEQQIREEMKRNGTLEDSQNMTEQERERLEQQINEQVQERLKQLLERLREMSRQNFTDMNATPMNFTDFNWSDLGRNFSFNQSQNQSWNQSMNWSQNQTWNWSQNQSWNQSMNWSQNQTWNWSSNFTQQGNWSSFNQTWNQSRLNDTYRDLAEQNNSQISRIQEEEQRRQEMLRNFTSLGNNSIVRSIQDIVSDPNNFWLMLLAALAGATAFATLLFARSKLASRRQQARAADIRKMFKAVNILEVIRRVEELGGNGKYEEAIILGYNGLADYIAFVFRILNDPSKTAREFAKSVESSVDVASLKTITFLFEKTKYAKKAGKKDYDEFLAALKELAKSGG